MDDASGHLYAIYPTIFLLLLGCASPKLGGTAPDEVIRLTRELDQARHEISIWKQRASQLMGQQQQSAPRESHNLNRGKLHVRNKVGPSNADPVIPSLSSEHLLYSNLIASYRQGQLNEAEYSLHLLLKAYPKSVHADNALYLVAHLAAYNASIEKALKYIDQLLGNYPYGNKVSAALLEKGRLLRRLGKAKQAKESFKLIVHRYPMSLEAKDAGVELEQI